MLIEAERTAVVKYAKLMLDSGLVVGTGGNISIYNREKGLIAITPGSKDYWGLNAHPMQLLGHLNSPRMLWKG
ncbi:MAG: class II aldolase/adducin family protein [Spirochaetia bacterium]|jgi:L-fuculose-phosphate aldolase|nr:class II aldolase/adducin family protein [Spirochaetia bacterium]